MKNIIIITIFVFASLPSISKKLYTTTSGELLFQFSDVGYQTENDAVSAMRFSLFFHYGEYLHWNFSKILGLYGGLAVRNVGLITKDEPIGDFNGEQIAKIKRRSYSLGIPIALKLGNLGKDFFLYGGAEYEMLFHYKQKYFSPSGEKIAKSTEWFSNATKRYVPSIFFGVQFPHGTNIRVKYYLTDFLNHNYSGKFGDYRIIEKSKIWYISLSFPFKNKKIKDKLKGRMDETIEL